MAPSQLALNNRRTTPPAGANLAKGPRELNGPRTQPPAQLAAAIRPGLNQRDLQGPPLTGQRGALPPTNLPATGNLAAKPLPGISFDPATGVTLKTTSNTNAPPQQDDTFTVSIGRRMDGKDATELYGVFKTKQEADKAIADIKQWAARIRESDAQFGIAQSDWDITNIQVDRQGAPPAAKSPRPVAKDAPASPEARPTSPAEKAAQRTWKKNAQAAADNLARDTDLSTALRQAASNSPYLSEADLRTIVAIESRGDRSTGKNKYGYAGLFQMGRDAAKQAGYDYKNLDEPSEWKTNVAAGVKYLDINARALERAGLDVTPLNVYMAHQQGAKGARRILGAVEDGTAATTPAGRNQLSNLPGSYVKGITDSGRDVTLQDYYDYWSESFRTVRERVNAPAPSQSNVRTTP